MTEKWKPILDNYEVSNLGYVRRVLKDGSTKQLKGSNNHKGYKYIQIQYNGIRKNYFIHRLVAEAFIGKRPEDKVVNHKDNNIHNNNVRNLEYVYNEVNAKSKLPYYKD